MDAEGAELAQDDDSGGDKNARIEVTLPESGIYTFLANSYEAGQSGTYQLRLRSADDDPRATEPSRLILREEGVLESGDSVLPSDGSLYDEYTFEAEAGQSVTIDLESSDFDPYLALFGPDGQLVGENDDVSESNRNSRLIVTLPATGLYRVVVNAYDSTGRGEYLLRVR
jgi:serine protease Do